MTPQQQKTFENEGAKFRARLKEIVNLPGTKFANFNCELCNCKTYLTAFTTFMYPDYSIKALCNHCGKKEAIRLDYSNKN